MNKHDRRLADSTAAAEESTRAMGNGYFAAAKAVGDFNMKLIEMAQGNTMAALNFAQQVATAKGPADAANLWSSYARERFETLTDQSRELTALAQRLMTSTAWPIANGFARTLPGST